MRREMGSRMQRRKEEGSGEDMEQKGEKNYQG